MRKKPRIHTPANNIVSNNQKIYYSAASVDEKDESLSQASSETCLKSVGGNVLLAKKIDYLMKNIHIAKNVRVRTKDNNLIKTTITGKNETHLNTKQGDIELSKIINIYLN